MSIYLSSFYNKFWHYLWLLALMHDNVLRFLNFNVLINVILNTIHECPAQFVTVDCYS